MGDMERMLDSFFDREIRLTPPVSAREEAFWHVVYLAFPTTFVLVVMAIMAEILMSWVADTSCIYTTGALFFVYLLSTFLMGIWWAVSLDQRATSLS